MPAPKGNQFWKARSKHGRDKIISDPKALWESSQEYFQWVEDNPFKKAIVFQGQVSLEGEPYMRPMTIKGLCIFLDICETTWSQYRKNKDFMAVITQVEAVIADQKFAGAAAGFFNANIIARDLGLKDASTKELTGRNGGPVEVDQKWEVEFINPEVIPDKCHD